MLRYRYLIALIPLLLISCQSATTPAAPAPSPTPQGPTVTSNNPDVTVESWEYINPRSEEALTFFPSGNPDAIRFGPEHYEAYVIWREGGFDLVWGNFICSTWPMLTIEETTIKLWLNDYVWDDCEAAEAIHAFKVELQTDIPPEAWSYTIYRDAPPEFRPSQTN